MHEPNVNPADRYVLPETTLLAVIGCLDLLSTIYLLATHQAWEANPIMANLLNEYGPMGFILFKALLLGVPLTIAEFARKSRPQFVRAALRVCIVLYLGIYGLSYLRYNLHLF